MSLTRRELLSGSTAVAAAAALPVGGALRQALATGRLPTSRLPAPFSVPFVRPPVLAPVRSDATTDYYRLEMMPTTQEVVPGLRTPLWGYGGSVPGPTIRADQGRRTVVRFVNGLPTTHPTLGYAPWTSVHLHGQASLPQFDGYASDITNPGQFKDYQYPNWQNARTLWYHDHGLHHTAENVIMGLAGMYVLQDDVERALPIPHGDYDVPLVVNDVMLNDDGTLLIDNHLESGMFGDMVCVNGRPWPVMRVARRRYRFRMLNASITRTYQWSLSTGAPMTVIGTDAGLVEHPQVVAGFRHAPAERYEVVVDFSAYRPGTRVVLRNTSPKNNIDYTNTNKVMAFDVTDDAFVPDAGPVPDPLVTPHPAMRVPETAAIRTRTLDFKRRQEKWTINGKTWDDVVRSGYQLVVADPLVDDVEVWELRNLSGGWHHPVHVHFVDFRVLTRNGAPAKPHERGPKDVVLVGEDETVRVLVKFEKGRGRYMIHCHNLVHEDHDMMVQFEIRDPAQTSSSPFDAPCMPLPESDL